MYEINFSNKNEIIEWLTSTSNKQKQLFEYAQKIRKGLCGDKVYLRGIVEVSNYCICDCPFCGNSIGSFNRNRYRLNYAEMESCIDYALLNGINVLHFASGHDKQLNKSALLKAIEYASRKDITVELALGYIDICDCMDYFSAGAKRYILKFETSDADLFKQQKKCTVTLDDYINRINELKRIGYSVGSGNIIGLPGQTIISLVDDLILLKRLDVDMASASIFIPNKDTKLYNYLKGDENLGLNYISLLRILFSDKNITIPSNSTFGLDGKATALQIAANELSYNITPQAYKGKYSLYSGQNRGLSTLEEIKALITDSNLKLSNIGDVLYG